MIRIQLTNVTKTFTMVTSLKDKLKIMLRHKSDPNSEFTALRNVDLTIRSGEVVGLVGVNGSGKSTLSNLISEIIYPTSGEATINGDVAIIAVAQGLKQVLTGRENIRLKCLMLGMTEAEIDERMPAIIDFADIGEFIDQPIKKYSSGMKSRLGFAIAVNVDADILIVDEALSVGDQTFYNKCIDRMNEFKEQGKTIIFVSHSLTQIANFCQRVVWLEYGRVREDGPVKEVLKDYKAFLESYKKMSQQEQRAFRQERLAAQKHHEDDVPPFQKEKREHLTLVQWVMSAAFLLVLVGTLVFTALDLSGIASMDLDTLFDTKIEIER